MSGGVRVWLAVVLLASRAPAQVSSGEYSVRVTAHDIVASRGAVEILNFRKIFEKPFAEFRESPTALNEDCVWEHGLDLVSLFGPYLGLYDSLLIHCPPSVKPSPWLQFVTYDLRTGKVVALTDLFDEPAVLAGLLANPVLRRYVKGKPASLAELLEALPHNDMRGVRIGPSGCEFSLYEDFRTRFALRGLEAGKVAASISLTPADGMCEAVKADVKILLPVPELLRRERFAATPVHTPRANIVFESKAK